MIVLPNECLSEILNNLKSYRRTLFSCLLVNRQWCRIVVPILWNKLNISRNQKLIRRCLLTLNAEEQAQLIPFKINLPNDSRPLFKYTDYTTVFNIEWDDGIKNWLKHDFNNLENSEIIYVVQAIRHSLILMILRTSKNLKCLSIDGKQVNLSKILDKCATLTSLKLSFNDLDFEELKVLSTALYENTTLNKLDISGNELDSEKEGKY
ncbi:hypothetical protein F8M41_009321 [Gigaspora margarita]|uniref:F-box domain-containing protein n=1 Tax=Gigaspora margarita TaxID=4874 RepID=A0A8H4B472_GIGMA|nr:hypothetical protein F8M41_009321 [Gigaspora margarita]